MISDPAPLAIPPLWGFGGDGACAVATERISKMSHRNTPSKSKVAPAKRAKTPAKQKRLQADPDLQVLRSRSEYKKLTSEIKAP